MAIPLFIRSHSHKLISCLRKTKLMNSFVHWRMRTDVIKRFSFIFLTLSRPVEGGVGGGGAFGARANFEDSYFQTVKAITTKFSDFS